MVVTFEASEASEATPLRSAATANTSNTTQEGRRHHGSALAIIIIAIASCLTAYTLLRGGPLPLYVTIVWFFAGTFLGRAVSPYFDGTAITSSNLPNLVPNLARSFTGRASELSAVTIEDEDEGADGAQKKKKKTKKKGWKGFVHKTKKMTAKYFPPPDESNNSVMTWNWFSEEFFQTNFTTLNSSKGRKRPSWETHADDRPSEKMMTLLLKNNDFATKPATMPAESLPVDATAACGTIAEEEEMEEGKLNGSPGRPGKFGTFDRAAMHASVMHRNYRKREIDPIFTLRGMDIFRTVGCPEEKIFRQPILNEGGLRDVPTFVMNVMLPFANLVLYFEMPEWVKTFGNIPAETEEDSRDVIAFKRFLTGDAAYRRPRMKVLATVIDGPWIVRSLAPPSSEIVFDFADWLRLEWHKQDEKVDRFTGKKQAALLEVDIDMMADPVARRIISTVRNSVDKVKMDCACVITAPTASKVEEPSACLGLWRMDRIDMHTTSLVPEKDEKQLVKEASHALLDVGN